MEKIDMKNPSWGSSGDFLLEKSCSMGGGTSRNSTMDPEGEAPDISQGLRASPLFGHVAFSLDHGYPYLSYRPTEGPLEDFSHGIIRKHPIALRSFATFPPIKAMQVELMDELVFHLQRDTGVTVWDVLKPLLEGQLFLVAYSVLTTFSCFYRMKQKLTVTQLRGLLYDKVTQKAFPPGVELVAALGELETLAQFFSYL